MVLFVFATLTRSKWEVGATKTLFVRYSDVFSIPIPLRYFILAWWRMKYCFVDCQGYLFSFLQPKKNSFVPTTRFCILPTNFFGSADSTSGFGGLFETFFSVPNTKVSQSLSQRNKLRLVPSSDRSWNWKKNWKKKLKLKARSGSKKVSQQLK